MQYSSIADARKAEGLRLSLTAGLPAPWSESAKAIFRHKNIPFTAVAQIAGEANEELVTWTGHRNAPTAMYNDEAPKASWLDLVNLAERLQPEPSLFPALQEDRIRMTGMLNELAGENGMLWNARQLMLHGMVQALGEEAVKDNPMLRDYRYSAEAVERAPGRVIEILDGLAGQLELKAEQGRRCFFGEQVSALDLYWACFSQILEPLPHEVNPMPDGVRKVWAGGTMQLTAGGYTPPQILLDHRQWVFEEIIGLPLKF